MRTGVLCLQSSTNRASRVRYLPGRSCRSPPTERSDPHLGGTDRRLGSSLLRLRHSRPSPTTTDGTVSTPVPSDTPGATSTGTQRHREQVESRTNDQTYPSSRSPRDSQVPRRTRREMCLSRVPSTPQVLSPRRSQDVLTCGVVGSTTVGLAEWTRRVVHCSRLVPLSQVESLLRDWGSRSSVSSVRPWV